MEKVMRANDKELMRMAMLKHEETFKQQVYELHRLYRIQKMLMDTTKNQSDQQKQDHRSYVADQIRATAFASDNQRLQAQRSTGDHVGLRVADHERIAESNNQMKIDENEIELTLSLGPTTFTPRRPRPDISESGQSTVSSSSSGSSQTRKISPKNSRSSARDFTWGSTAGGNISINNNNNHQGSESVDPGFLNGQKNNQPWMFQALSLKLS